MEKKTINFKKILEKMKPTDYIYLGVLFIFIISVLIIFSFSTRFIVQNINKILSSGNTENVDALNINQYKFVADKFNIQVNLDPDNPSQAANQAPIQEATTPVNTPKTPVIPTLDKKLITIEILNSTKKKGVAATLNTALVNVGFNAATIGNEKKSYETTVIMVNESKKDYLPSIQEVVNKVYPSAITQVISGKSGTDATIIIGKR